MEEIKMHIKLVSEGRSPRPKPRCEENSRTDLQGRPREAGLYSTDSGQNPVVGSCDHGDWTLGSHKRGGISWWAERLSSFQGLLCSTELMTWVEVPTEAAKVVYNSLWFTTLTECKQLFTPLPTRYANACSNKQERSPYVELFVSI